MPLANLGRIWLSSESDILSLQKLSRFSAMKGIVWKMEERFAVVADENVNKHEKHC